VRIRVHSRLLVRGGFVAVVVVLGVAMFTPSASAHALVRSSDPADGAVLDRSPAAVTITFTEPPDPTISFIHVLNASGTSVERGSSEPVPGKPLELEVPLPSLPKGVYTVTWRTVSKVDGHVTGGSFTFGIGETPGPSTATSAVQSPSTPSPSPLAALGRWAFYWGLALLLGGSVFVVGVAPSLMGQGRSLLTGAWLATAIGLLLMLVAERSQVGISYGDLLGSATGKDFIERAIALGVLGVVLAIALLWPTRWSFSLLAAAAAAGMLVHALAGHAAASSPVVFNVAVQWFHLVAVGIWIGGLGWLLMALRTKAPGERAPIALRFSAVATAALAIVALTGLLRALDEVGWPGQWHRLFDTSFGTTVLIKVGLFAILLALGALNHYVNVPALARGTGSGSSLGRTVLGELGVAVAILAVTGVMTQLPPASTLAAAASTPPTPRTLVLRGADFATTTRAVVTVTPGTVGPNTFAVRLLDYDTGRPITVRSVSIQFSLPDQPDLGTPTLTLDQTPSGTWSGRGTTISMYGSWDLTILAQQASSAVTIPLRLVPRLPAEHIQTARAPGEPTLYTVDLGSGDTLQAYVDPGAPGPNTVHFTFFQAGGNELPIHEATAFGTAPDGSTTELQLTRFDPAHFAANATLTPGMWRFVIQAMDHEGTLHTAYFDQTIGQGGTDG
jgi:copper transport protein